MKRFTHLFFLMFAGMFGAIPLHSLGQTIVNMPQFGKQEVEVSDDEVIFYDMKGEEDIASATANNSCASIVFKPSVQGKAIQISFEYFDVFTDGSSFPAYLKVYNGIFDAENTFVYPTATSGVTTGIRFPYTSNLLDSLDVGKKGPELTNKTYVSSDPTGCLSVAYLYKYAGKCRGWKAKVSCVTVADMQVTTSGSSYEQLPVGAYAGKQGVGLLGFYVNAEGIMNPEHLTSCSFTIPMNEGVIDPTELKLYAGMQPYFKGATPVQAVLTEDNSVYTFTFDKLLVSGINRFTVVGNIKTNAPFDAQMKIAAVGVKTSGHMDGVPDFSVANAQTVSVSRVVLMPSEAKIYDVSAPVTLYDDGGEDGNISEGFEGQVTFKPTTSGSKVMIDFTKLDLFNTSSVGKNDILKIYYGDKVDESQLAATLLKEKAATIRSNAGNGALTVTLKSTTGVAKSGFEATVSEFVPQTMIVSEVIPAQYTDGTVTAGDTDQAILSVNIKAENTEPALTVNKVAFSTGNTFGKLTKATLYYTKANSEFSSGVKVGEAVINTDAFEITAVSAIALTEGNNFFWLTYNISDDAQTGDKVDAGVTAVTFSDGKHQVENGNPVGDRTVKNEYVSQEGTYVKTVNGEWEYSYVCSSAYSSNEHRVTFTPKSSDMIMEMEYQSFKLYFPVSTTQTYAIYSGTEVNADKCIWKVTSSDKTPVLNKVIRPMEGDASLTIVYNANGVSSSSAYGWKALVREYRSVPMVCSGIDVFQASTAVIKPGAVNQPVIGFKVSTTGDKSPLKLNGLTLDMKGCQNNIKKVSVYYAGADSLFTMEHLIGELIPTTETQASIAFTTPLLLPENKSYYWVTYDMQDGVAPEQTIDGALLSLTIGEEKVTPVNGDPAGERVTKNVYELQNNDKSQVVVDGSMMFYDDGGKDANYAKVLKGQVTFLPKDPTKIIRLSVVSFKTRTADYLYYNSGSTFDKSTALKYSGSDAAPVFTSLEQDGSVTARFETGYNSGSSTGEGWEIEVTEITPMPLSLGEVKTTVVNNASFLRGMKNEPMLKIAVEVKGEKGSLDISKLTFDAASTSNLQAIAGVSVFATDTCSNFAAHYQYGETLTVAPYQISDNYVVKLPGVYNFWLTYDVASTAKDGDKLEAKLAGITAAGIDTPIESSIASAMVAKGFKGIYTVGASAEAYYGTLTAAIDAMKNGIEGPVVLELESGTYEEVCVFPQIDGASKMNNIIIKSKTGKYQDVVIAKNTYSEPAYGEEKDGMFTIKGVDYLTIEGITFTTTAAWPYLMDVKNISNHLTLRNCKFAKTMETNYSGTKLLYTEAKNETYANSDNLLVQNCLFEGGYIATDISGTGYTKLPKMKYVRLLNNIFRNQGSMSMYLHDVEDVLVSGNEVSNDQTDKGGFNALDLYRITGTSVISGNTVTLATKAYSQAIYIRPFLGTEEAPIRVYNNVINFTNTVGASIGIYFTSSASEYVDVAYNTVRMNGTATAASAIPLYINNTIKGVNVRNNIFQNEVGGLVIKIGNETYLSGAIFSNNALYTNSETQFAYVGSGIATFEGWKQKTSDTGSFEEKTLFLSDKVLEPSVVGQLNTAKPLEYVTTDIAGLPRSASTPTIGAYEFSTENTQPEMAKDYPTVSGIKHNEATVTVKSSLSGKAFFLAKVAAEEAPAVENIIAAAHTADVKKDIEATFKVDALECLTDYVVYVVLQNLKGLNSEVSSVALTTTYEPTKVSTFENVTVVAGEDFEDGTASFSGFTVEAITDGVGSSKKAIKLGTDGGLITLTNSSEGLPLTGFYLKSDAVTRLTVYGKEGTGVEVTLVSTNGQWIFANLKDKGEITGLLFSSTGNVYVDNFSGQPQPITYMIEDQSVNEGESVTLSTDINGGVPPYVYKWTNAKMEELSTDLSYTFAPKHVGEYTLSVTDAWGSKTSGKTVVKVMGKAYAATFDDLYLADESHWRGDEESDEMNNVFYSGSYAFDNVLMKDYDTWALWGYSNETSTEYTGKLTEQFRSAVGHGVNSSANYGIAYASNYMGITKVGVLNSAIGDSIQGCYITNSAWAKDAVLTGDGVIAGDMGFETGDWFKLTAKGKDAEGKTSTVDFYLADYRSDTEADRYCLDSWQWFDLRALGRVTEVSFELSSSKNNSYGMTTPSYFCMDDFNGKRTIIDVEEQKVGLGETSVRLAQFFTLESADAMVTYHIEDAFNTTVIGATIQDGMLVIDGKTDKSSLSLVISAVQQGKKQFVRIPVAVDSAVGINNTVHAESVSVYPVPAIDKLNVATDMEDYLIEIISVNGMRVLMQDNNSGNVSINVSGLENGVYLLKMSNTHSSFVKRFTKAN